MSKQYYVIPKNLKREEFLEASAAIKNSFLGDEGAARAGWANGQAVISMADAEAYRRFMSGHLAADDPATKPVEKKAKKAPSPSQLKRKERRAAERAAKTETGAGLSDAATAKALQAKVEKKAAA